MASTTPRRSSPRSTRACRTYVLDTSVLLADPAALMRFDEHEVVLPIVVVTELEAKRHHPELGYFARQALRILDEVEILGVERWELWGLVVRARIKTAPFEQWNVKREFLRRLAPARRR